MSIENDDDYPAGKPMPVLTCAICDTVTDLTGVDPQYLPTDEDAWLCVHCNSWNNEHEEMFDLSSDDDDVYPPTSATRH